MKMKQDLYKETERVINEFLTRKPRQEYLKFYNGLTAKKDKVTLFSSYFIPLYHTACKNIGVSVYDTGLNDNNILTAIKRILKNNPKTDFTKEDK